MRALVLLIAALALGWALNVRLVAPVPSLGAVQARMDEARQRPARPFLPLPAVPAAPTTELSMQRDPFTPASEHVR